MSYINNWKKYTDLLRGRDSALFIFRSVTSDVLWIRVILEGEIKKNSHITK